jgi:hypothetical protein
MNEPYAQRELDRASGAALDRRATVRELAEHYDGRVPQWYIEAAETRQDDAFEDLP